MDRLLFCMNAVGAIMSEASIDVAEAEESFDVPREKKGLQYHKKGHTFYKTRYYQTKARLNRLRVIAIGIAVLLMLVTFKVASLDEEKVLLEEQVSRLEQALYDRS